MPRPRPPLKRAAAPHQQCALSQITRECGRGATNVHARLPQVHSTPAARKDSCRPCRVVVGKAHAMACPIRAGSLTPPFPRRGPGTLRRVHQHGPAVVSRSKPSARGRLAQTAAPAASWLCSRPPRTTQQIQQKPSSARQAPPLQAAWRQQAHARNGFPAACQPRWGRQQRPAAGRNARALQCRVPPLGHGVPRPHHHPSLNQAEGCAGREGPGHVSQDTERKLSWA